MWIERSKVTPVGESSDESGLERGDLHRRVGGKNEQEPETECLSSLANPVSTDTEVRTKVRLNLDGGSRSGKAPSDDRRVVYKESEISLRAYSERWLTERWPDWWQRDIEAVPRS